MRISNYNETFALEGAAIDRFSEQVEESLCQIEMERQNRLRIRLSLEEALLRMRDRFGEEQMITAIIRRRFGRLVIRLELEGDAFNPLSAEETELENLCSSLLTAVGLSPQYTYSGHGNLLRLSLPIPGFSPAMKILIGVLGGVLIGVLGEVLLSEAIQNAFITNAMTPIYEAWLRILNVLSGPVIFFMTITTVINSGEISERGGDNHRIVARYFLLSFAMTALAMIAATTVYGIAHSGIIPNTGETVGLLQNLLNIIPDDFVTPFAESNTPQLLLMALVLGEALNILGSQGKNLSRIIRQMNMVGLQLCDWISKLVPWFACVLVGFEIWQGRTAILKGMWLTLLISLVVSLVCIGLVLCYVARREGISVQLLARKLMPPFITTLKTGSLDAAYGLTERCCAADLGIQRSFTSVGLPNGLVLYMPISAVGTLVFIAFAGMKYGIIATPLWFVMAVVLSVVVFVATPPVPGANLLAYVVTLSVLGIPGEALIDAMVFDLVFGIFASAGNQALLQMELILQSDKIGMLNKIILQKE
ncbi:MAG: cation:dicarboxylase symporter family transporter [Firmicutes bacterium]|nr:cation:dicarboxylase symporter family transporter [Bacillota bacterium]